MNSSILKVLSVCCLLCAFLIGCGSGDGSVPNNDNSGSGSGGGGDDGSSATNPSVSTVSPPNESADVDAGSTIVVTFSSSIDETTLDGNLTLSCDGENVAGTITWDADNLQATFTPSSGLPEGADCTLSLSANITDGSGTPLTAYSSTFTTIITLPSISSVVDADGNTIVAAGSSILPAAGSFFVTFSEDIDSATVVTGETLTLTCNGVEIVGTITEVSASEYRFTYSELPQNGCIFTVVGGTGGIADLYENTLAASSTYRISSACGPDDSFDDSTTLAGCWTEVDANGYADIDFNTSNAGAMTYNHSASTSDDAPPHIYKKVAGDFAVTAYFDNVVVDDNDEFLYFGIADAATDAANEIKLKFGESVLVMGPDQVVFYDKTEDNVLSDNNEVTQDSGDDIYLCVVNNSGTITGFYSFDNITYTAITNATVELNSSISFVSIGGYAETFTDDGFSFQSPGVQFNEGTATCLYE